MRRRSKPQLDAKGKPLAVPPELMRFNLAEWPGTSDHHRWEHWWAARAEWEVENLAPGEPMPGASGAETQPRLTAEDITRLI